MYIEICRKQLLPSELPLEMLSFSCIELFLSFFFLILKLHIKCVRV